MCSAHERAQGESIKHIPILTKSRRYEPAGLCVPAAHLGFYCINRLIEFCCSRLNYSSSTTPVLGGMLGDLTSVLQLAGGIRPFSFCSFTEASRMLLPQSGFSQCRQADWAGRPRLDARTICAVRAICRWRERLHRTAFGGTKQGKSIQSVAFSA